MMTDDEVRRLLRESDLELPEDPSGQAEVLAWLTREMRAAAPGPPVGARRGPAT